MGPGVGILVSVGRLAIYLHLYAAIILMGDQSIRKWDAAIHFQFISELYDPCCIYVVGWNVLSMHFACSSAHLVRIIYVPIPDLRSHEQWCCVHVYVFYVLHKHVQYHH